MPLVLSETVLSSQACTHTVFEGGIETILPSFVEVGSKGEDVTIEVGVVPNEELQGSEEDDFRGVFTTYEVGEETVLASCDGFLLQVPRRECGGGLKEGAKLGVTIRKRT